MRHSSRPRRFDWPAARFPGYTLATDIPCRSVSFLKAALPPSYCRTGTMRKLLCLTAARRSRFRPLTTHGLPRYVDPAALPGRRGARRSFWDVASTDATVGTPRQKVCWPIPHMCLVPPTGSTVTAMTEPRGVAEGQADALHALQPSKPHRVKPGNSGCAA
jgi:hypothetical protein